MTELTVRMVRLEPMRVAFTNGFGPSPEEEAWDTLLTWARSKGLLDHPESVRFFGHNNPDPGAGSPNYGYDQWMTVGPEVQAQPPVHIKDFPGGLFAVTRCRGVQNLPETWKQLVTWLEDSAHRFGNNQCLEECLTPPLGVPNWEEAVFDIYLPIAE